MSIQLDHVIVPSRDRKTAAALLGGILGVPWSAETHAGPFSPVYVNGELTWTWDRSMPNSPPSTTASG